MAKLFYSVFTVGFLITVSEVNAGQLQITAGPSANLTQYSVIRTISDANLINRVIPALKWQYGQKCTADGATCIDFTNAELMSKLFTGFNQAVTDIIKRYELEQARITADQGVGDLP